MANFTTDTPQTTSTDTDVVSQEVAPELPEKNTGSSFLKDARVRLSLLAVLMIALSMISKSEIGDVRYRQLLKSWQPQKPVQKQPSIAQPTTRPGEPPLSDAECDSYQYKPIVTLDSSKTKEVSGPDARSIQLDLQQYSVAAEEIAKSVPAFASVTGFISSTAYHQETDSVAYLQLPQQYPVAGDTITVWLYNFTTAERTEVLSQKLVGVSMGGGGSLDTIGITDVGFTPDGSQLMITSNNAISLYTIASKELKKVYEDANSGGKAAFYQPQLSADKNKILVGIGYYEGSSSGVFDMSTQTFAKLPFGSYGRGSDVIGWKGDELEIYQFEDDDSKMCWGTWQGKNVYCSEALFPIFGRTAFKPGEALVGTQYTDEPTQQVLCNSENQKYEVDAQIERVMYAQVTGTELTELFAVDVTNSSGMKERTEIAGLSFGKIAGTEYVIVKITTTNKTQETVDAFYAVDPKQPGTVARLILK